MMHFSNNLGSICNSVLILYSIFVEAMGQKYLNALNGSIWLEAEDVMNKSWGIWCQRISLREELRGGYSNALVGVKTQDIGDACK